ncbi:MAG TPA: MFS transporter [Caulobacteraceae bacterium]|nr:MFS transporter [Caulobacteraceae bacterium]
MLAALREMDRRQWSAAVASFLGWTLDAFDFFLMVFMFAAIARDFHASIAAVAAASAVTLAARPFGALFFGLLADRYGRRPVLMVDVLAFSALELAAAFAPSLPALIVLRAAFGFAMGGEWGVGASLALETAPARARGAISGLLQEGYAVGYLLAALAFALLFDKIGWRGMFMIGVIPALLAGFIRLGVAESPAFAAPRPRARQGVGMWGLGLGAAAVALAPSLLAIRWPAHLLTFVYAIDAPLALAGLLIFRRFWKLALYVVALMTAFNLFSHGTQDLYPTFLTRQHHLPTATVGFLTALANVGAILGGLGFGAWSEALGRRRAIMVAALASLLVIPLWAFSHTLAALAAGAFLIQVMVQGAWGVIPAHLNELSPGEVRGAFPGFLYQCGNLLASGLIVWQARLAEARGGDYGSALAIVAALVAILILVLVVAGPERRQVALAGVKAPEPT